MESRNKHGLSDLWWFMFCAAICVTILCTSMLVGRRLSTEKSTVECDWLNLGFPLPLVDQVMIVIIDALTPRVALGPKHAARRHQQQQTGTKTTEHIPRESGWFTCIRDELEKSSSSNNNNNPFPSLGFFSVADAPTTTAQRTKAMVTGTIPVLLEAGTSFNSFAVEEDNLLEKLGGRSAVLGDDTWVRLFPDKKAHWQFAHVFESFDVRDLHTVDNGILQHLQSTLRNEDDSDEGKEDAVGSPPKLLITHFLGVDHAGHQYNARDPHLFAKVDQLNHVLLNITQFLKVERSAKRGESTLLLVMGDHGMTEGGDHGGSTPSETDTFLFAQVFPAAVTTKDQQQQRNSQSRENEEKNQKKFITQGELLDLARWFTRNVRVPHCDISRLCRITKPSEIDKYCERVQCASLHQVVRNEAEEETTITTTLTAIHQIDLVPTLAAILGVSIPRQNLGRIVPELILLALTSFCGGGSSSSGSSNPASSSVCTVSQVEVALRKLLGCNVDQLRVAFCTEFSSQQHKFCESQSSSSSSSSSNSLSSSSFADAIKDLDETAARLTRAAREALTDVDIAAVLVALALGFTAGFSSVWHYMFSTSVSLRWRQVMFRPKRFFIATLLSILVLYFLCDCKSMIALFIAVPCFFATFFALDGKHWLSQLFELLPVPFVHRRFYYTSASLAFLVFVVKIGSQMSNSFIVLEDVISCMIGMSMVVYAQHLQSVRVKLENGNSDSNTCKKNTRLRSVLVPVSLLGGICSGSLYLGRRLRDFDSHFVDAESNTQRLLRWLSKRGTLMKLNQQQNQQQQHSGMTTLVDSVKWVLFDSCFIHALLFATIAVLVVLHVFVHRTAVVVVSHKTKTFVRVWSWRIFFAVGFFWNCVVSNATSLQAFVSQSIFLFLWVRWFPLSKLRQRMTPQTSSNNNNASSLSDPSSPIFRRRLQHVCNAVDGLTLHMTGWLFFFAAGSQCMFSTIDWNMAFVGVSNVNFAAGGTLMVVHTFRSFIVNAVVAVYVDSEQRRLQREAASHKSKNDDDDDNEDDDDQVEERGKNLHSSVVGLGATLFFINTALCVTMCYSMVRHRGHLMSWEVFFPRFAFEVGVFIVQVAGLLFLSLVSV